MKRLTVLVVGALVLGACASGPAVGGDVASQGTDPAASEPANEGRSVVEEATEKVEAVSDDEAGDVIGGSEESGPIDLPADAADNTMPEDTVDLTPTTTGTKPPASPPSRQSADFAIADLAGRLAVATNSVAVVSIEEVTWPDGSLGCPEPGMSYTQSLVNGSRVILESGGIQYEYHSGPDGELFYCPNPTPPVEGSGYGDV